MYKIYINNELFCDSSINDLSVINPVVTLEANTAGQFTFTVPVTHPYYDNITRLTSVVEVYRENKMVFRGFVAGESKDLWNNKAITCEGDLSYLNDSILRPHKWQGETVRGLLEKYIYGGRIDGHYFYGHNDHVEARKRFEVGVVTVQDPNDSISCYTNMNSTMKEIKEDLVDDLGGYIRIRRHNNLNYIDYIRQEDFPTASQTIELGVNLIDYNSNIDDIDLCTQVIPLGALLEEQEISGLDTRLTIKGQPVSTTHKHTTDDYLENTDAVDSYGIISKTVTFDDVTTASALVTKGDKYLSQNQFESLVIEVTAVDLGLIDDGVNTWELLQNIRVKSAVHGLDAYFPLTKMVLNLANPEKDTFTLGTKGKLQSSLTARTTEASNATKKIANSVNEAAWLSQAKTNALNMLLDETQGGYVVLEYHYDSNNQPDYIEAISVCNATTIESSTKRWRWSQNGFGYMERQNISSSWGTLKVAMTNDGSINADRILTGILRSIEIYNGTNGQFHVDPNGSVTASDISITGGDITLTSTSDTVPKISVVGAGTSLTGKSISISPVWIRLSISDHELYLSASGLDYNGTINDTQINDNGILITGGNTSQRYVEIGDGEIRVKRTGYSSLSVIQNNYIELQNPSLTRYTSIYDDSIVTEDIYCTNLHCEGGSKQRVVNTKSYGSIGLYAYETPKPTFADEGHGLLDEDGVCYVYIDPVFMETIDTVHEYRIFLTKYAQGDIWVEEVDKAYFMVKGTPGIEFDWKIDCIQRDYNHFNLEKFQEKDRREDINYELLADQYLRDLESEVLSA